MYTIPDLRKDHKILGKETIKKAMVFLALGLTGVLPIMISMKQSGFYILSTYPVFSIGISILMYPFLNSLLIRINYSSKSFLFFKWISYGLFSTGIILSICYSDGYSRDSNKIKDTYAILAEISQGSIININPDMKEDWSLHAYFGRFKNVSLDPDLSNNRDYLLIKNEYYSDTLKFNFQVVKLKTLDYQLFKKK